MYKTALDSGKKADIIGTSKEKRSNDYVGNPKKLGN